MNNQKILITGAKGMLGSMMTSVLQNEYSVIALDHKQLDICSDNSINDALDKYTPDFVINCAAYTNVDNAEDEIELSNLVNGKAPGMLSDACAQRSIKFIHFSTDYVFGDNSKNGHDENDEPVDQINQYGKSKRLGEIEVLKNKDSKIIRTSWVLGPNGKNFVDTMLRLSQSMNELKIVSDEYGTPTYTKDISLSALYLIKNFTSLNNQIYHCVNEGTCSRLEQALKVFEIAAKSINVLPILLKDYPRKAKIANYSILKNTRLPKLQAWNLAIKEYIAS